MIVIDDEYLVRLGIRETIDWKKYNIKIVGEADNGREGLELVHRLKPDVVLTDIKMPVMDGLELVRALKDVDCVPVILSGYKDFDYAKETLENGAYSYLLKPIDNDELVQVVTDALEELSSKRKKEHYYRQLEEQLPDLGNKVLNELLEGSYDTLDATIRTIDLYDIPIIQRGHLIYGQIDDEDGIYAERDRMKSIDALYGIITDNFKSKQVSYYGQLNPQDFILLVAMDDLVILTEMIEQSVTHYEQNHQAIVSLGISLYYDDFDRISEAYNQAKEGAQQKLFYTLNTVTVYNDHQDKYKPQIVEAIRYIAEHYHENITVKNVADALYISDSYLMHLFRENVGKTFNEVLTDYRLLIAKKLLLSNQYKIYEIAEMVGYSDVKYFSQVFRKKEGMSPSQYMNSIQL